MSDEAAFLRAICENPDEDTPRLVFADWLAEQGGAVNAAWANGIRAQVWLARGATDAAYAQQSKVFESGYGLAKVRERLGLPTGLTVTEWERGFPTMVMGSFLGLRPDWRRLAFRVPIRKFHVYDVSVASTSDLVTWPALSVLRELTFGSAWEAPQPGDVLSILAGCAAFRGLELLAVAYALLTDAGVTAILDSPHLAGLKTLTLHPGYNAEPLSPKVEERLRERFGPDALGEDDIPF
jgi:uncharacterized protein (TIGR02996 family)